MVAESAEPAAAVEPEKAAAAEGDEAPAAEVEDTTAAAEEVAPVEEVKVRVLSNSSQVTVWELGLEVQGVSLTATSSWRSAALDTCK